MITKPLISGALAVAICIGESAPVSADPRSVGGDPHKFNVLSCSCQETAPTGSPVWRGEVDQGIEQGLSRSWPGLAAPAQPREP